MSGAREDAWVQALLRVRRARVAAAERDLHRARVGLADVRSHALEARAEELRTRARMAQEQAAAAHRLFGAPNGLSPDALRAERGRGDAARAALQSARGTRLLRLTAWRDARARVGAARAAMHEAARREVRTVELSTRTRGAPIDADS